MSGLQTKQILLVGSILVVALGTAATLVYISTQNSSKNSQTPTTNSTANDAIDTKKQTTNIDQPQSASTTSTERLQSDSMADKGSLSLPATTSTEAVYIQVTESCDHNFAKDPCVEVRSGPGTQFDVVSQLRNDMVLKVEKLVNNQEGGWYKIAFDQTIRYPERIEDDWYLSAEFAKAFTYKKPTTSWEDGEATSTDKRIVVDRNKNMLYAYDGEELFLKNAISAGVELTPTPSGTFRVFKKMPSRYMQGPIPSLAVQDKYDLPGVPWNLYFTQGGAIIHGAYWHNDFGNPHSHGCVNLPPVVAKELYDWAVLGTTVIVQD